MTQATDPSLPARWAREIDELWDGASAFLKALESRGSVQGAGGTLDVSNATITGSVFRVQFVANPRIVVGEPNLAMYCEFAFYAKLRDKDICIDTIYLSRNGKVLSAPRENSILGPIADLDNPDIGERILAELALAIVQTPFFRPARPDWCDW